ncbi:hypothetical protein M9458_026237, partial [Cirrhinus mrigala]
PKPKPTTNGEPMPTTINKPLQRRTTELEIVPEPEPATVLATREKAMESKSTEGSSTHCIMAE